MHDFRVKTFLTVCRTLNYTQAAAELSLSQPAVSQHISYLEREYGAKLFTYEHKKLELTDAGRLLKGALATMAHDEQLLRERVAEAAHGQATLLRIGMTLTAGEYVVADPLVRYLAKHPEINVTVRSGGTKQLLGLLDDGEIDCAFVEGLFDKSAYAHDVFSTERLVCICAAGHAFSTEPTSFESLLGERLILREETSGSRDVLAHALAGRNLTTDSFAYACVVESLDIIKRFVAGDFGVSFVYESAIQRELADGTLRIVELPDSPIFHNVSFVRLPGSIFESELHALARDLRAS